MAETRTKILRYMKNSKILSKNQKSWQLSDLSLPTFYFALTYHYIYIFSQSLPQITPTISSPVCDMITGPNWLLSNWAAGNSC